MTINRAVAQLIRIVLVSAFLIPPGFAQQPQPTPQGPSAKTIKIESKIRRIGIRADATVKLLSGKTYHGFINRIDDEEFEMSEVDLKTNVVVRYDQVKKVESGYGNKGPLGNRVGKKGRRIGLIIGLAAIAIPLIIAGTAIED